MNFRNNWGFEINLDAGKSKDEGILTILHIMQILVHGLVHHLSGVETLYGGYSKTYNFSREYLAFYSWGGA